jgi:hypothetical protein
MSIRTSITRFTLSLLLAVGVAGVRADDKLENQELLISLQIAAAKIQALEARQRPPRTRMTRLPKAPPPPMPKATS